MRIKCDDCRYTSNCRFKYDEDYPDYLRYIRAETCTRFEENTDTLSINSIYQEENNESKNKLL